MGGCLSGNLMYIQTVGKVLLKIKRAEIFCQKVGDRKIGWFSLLMGFLSTLSETAYYLQEVIEIFTLKKSLACEGLP